MKYLTATRRAFTLQGKKNLAEMLAGVRKAHYEGLAIDKPEDIVLYSQI
jgi:hypothetical protein